MNMVSASRMKQETILLTVRPLDEKGKWQYKTEKEYLCVKGGEERGFTAAEFKQAQADGSVQGRQKESVYGPVRSTGAGL